MVSKYNLQQQVEDVIQFSQAYPFDLDCGPLIDKWYDNKTPFINLFGGLIYRFPQKIQITVTDEERKSSFASFVNTLTENGIFSKSQDCGNLSFLDFLYENKEGFHSNKVLISHPELKISKNQRLLKVFRKFFNEDEQTTRWVQDTASMYIQGSKVEGYLYLSIHPLDYLLMSETNCGWTSCHSLDGDFRYGNLNYMVDKTTIVAYLAETEEEHLRSLPPGMTWRNKKWRMLVHTNRDSIIYYNKGYPFNSFQLVLQVRHILDNLMPEQKFSYPIDAGFIEVKTAWNDRMLLGEPYIYYHGEMFPASSLIDTTHYFGFCDLGKSISYAPIISVSEKASNRIFDEGRKAIEEEFAIKIGETAPCPCCGKEEYPDSAEYMLCGDCMADNDVEDQFYLKCDGCGHRIYDEEEAYKIEETHDLLCKKCFNSLEEGEKKNGKAWRHSKRESK